MSIFVGWAVVGLVSALFLVGVVLAVRSMSAPDPARPTRVLLVLLRLAIGWHFFVEGMDKVHTPAWTSAGYLREATGPLAPRFRSLAGDALVDALEVQSDGSISSVLDRDWENYLAAFERFYELSEGQSHEAAAAMSRAKIEAAKLLSSTPKIVEKIAAYPPPLKVPMTMAERLKEYDELKQRVREKEEEDLPLYGSAAFDAWKTAKANANRWRAELQKDLLLLNKQMKRVLRDVLFQILDDQLPAEKGKKIQAAVKKLRDQAGKEVAAADARDWDAIDSMLDKRDAAITDLYRAVFVPADDAKLPVDAQAALIRDNTLERRGKDQPSFDPLLTPVSRPWGQWDLLDWSDHIVKYGLAAVGVMLLVGLATRLACVAGAAFLLMFFLAMPPLPGWPESPRVEGHYLFINKNVIEMLALLVLATTRSGRWSGLDGVLQFLNPWRWRKPAEAGKIT